MTQIEARWANRKVPYQGMARRDAAQALAHAAIMRKQVAYAKAFHWDGGTASVARQGHGQCLDAARRARARAEALSPCR